MKSIDSIIREQVKKIVEDMDIDPENKGKFTATQKRTGKSTDELCHSKNPLTRKRANFAKMAKRHWKPLDEQFCREVMESTIRRIMKEGLEGNLSGFEEYAQGYPGGKFDVSGMSAPQLAEWCQSHGHFLYVYEGLGGLKIMAANTKSIIQSIISDLYNCDGIEPTHEVDYLLEERPNEFDNNYVCVFKVKGTPDGDYYIIYQKDKSEVTESRKRRVNEAFRSDELRSWFKEHGGVKKHFDEYPDASVPQEGAGDIDDDDIVYKKEYDDYNQAVMVANKLNHEKKSDMSRSDMSTKALFTVYRANDGKCLVVGIDRANNPNGVNWGGEHLKKKSDRIWRDDRKKWDANDYEYGRSAKYFGVHDDKDFKGLGKYNKGIRQRSTDDEWNDYQRQRVKDMKDYYRNNHIKG